VAVPPSAIAPPWRALTVGRVTLLVAHDKSDRKQECCTHFFEVTFYGFSRALAWQRTDVHPRTADLQHMSTKIVGSDHGVWPGNGLWGDTRCPLSAHAASGGRPWAGASRSHRVHNPMHLIRNPIKIWILRA
jgi:hypothetical protein